MENINNILTELELKKDHKKYFNISYNLAQILSNLVKTKSPKHALELGTSNGYSGLHIIKSLKKNSTLTTIEVDEGRYNEAKENFQRAGVSNQVKQLLGEIFEILDKETFQNQFDFIFLDAAHKKYKQVIETLANKNLIEQDALIVCDNVISHKTPQMQDFVEFMKQKFKTQIIETDSGFLVAKYEKL